MEKALGTFHNDSSPSPTSHEGLFLSRHHENLTKLVSIVFLIIFLFAVFLMFQCLGLADPRDRLPLTGLDNLCRRLRPLLQASLSYPNQPIPHPPLSLGSHTLGQLWVALTPENPMKFFRGTDLKPAYLASPFLQKAQQALLPTSPRFPRLLTSPGACSCDAACGVSCF